MLKKWFQNILKKQAKFMAYETWKFNDTFTRTL
jgi:hypothetical protein